jgi:hypothetical protein
MIKRKRKINEFGSAGFSLQPKYYGRGMSGFNSFGGSSGSGGPTTMYTYNIVALNHNLEQRPSENEFVDTINIGDIITGKEINKGKKYSGTVVRLVKSPNNNTLLYYLIVDKNTSTKIKIDPTTATLNVVVGESLIYERNEEEKLQKINEYWDEVINRTKMNINKIIDNLKNKKNYFIKVNDTLGVEFTSQLFNGGRTIAKYREKDNNYIVNYIQISIESIFEKILNQELDDDKTKYTYFRDAIIDYESSIQATKLYKLLKFSFEHELTHHYDELKYGEKYSEQSFIKSKNLSDIKDIEKKSTLYANLSHEINAFFISSIKSLTDNEGTVYNWDEFWEIFVTYFKIYNKLSELNKRRIQSRAYQYFIYQKSNSYHQRKNEYVFEDEKRNILKVKVFVNNNNYLIWKKGTPTYKNLLSRFKHIAPNEWTEIESVNHYLYSDLKRWFNTVEIIKESIEEPIENQITEKQIKDTMHEKNISRANAIRQLYDLEEWIRDQEEDQKSKKIVSESLNEFLNESPLLLHSEDELKRAGLFNKDADYEGMIAYAVMDLMKTFTNQGHSGFSAGMVREIFNKLSNWETLTPITSDPNEWNDVSEMSDQPFWQNKRNPCFFSQDGGKTWWDVNDKQTMNEAYKLALLNFDFLYASLNEKYESLTIPQIKEKIQNLKNLTKEYKDIAVNFVKQYTHAEKGKVSGLNQHPDLKKKIREKSLPNGFDMGIDKNGFYIHTHRARSKSHPKPDGITEREIKFIDSTG